MKRILNLKTLAMLISLSFAAGVSAQGMKDIRINEIQVYNTDGYTDAYGHRVGWIELFNSGHSKVDVGGAYFKVEGKEYRIPKNDPRTVIAPQGYLIFFAEGTASKGTFHTNFTLEETNYIVLYDQSGRGKAADSLYYDHADMIENVSYGWFEDHDGHEKLMNLPANTPMATNNTLDKQPRDEHFRQADPSGFVMSITAMSVVFCALILLYLIFKGLGKFQISLAHRKEIKAKLKDNAEHDRQTVKAAVKSGEKLKGEELAAIAYALFLFSEELQDIENSILTLRDATRAYSPWSSKLYGLRQTPIKK